MNFEDERFSDTCPQKVVGKAGLAQQRPKVTSFKKKYEFVYKC